MSGESSSRAAGDRGHALSRAASRRLNEKVVSTASVVALLLLWEVASRGGWIDARIFPAPTMVVATIYDMYTNRGFLSDTLITIARFLFGTLFGVVPGLFIGLTMGLFQWWRVTLQPIVAALYNAPRIALFPLVLISVGLNETSNMLMIALGPFFTMLITAMGAVLSVDKIYREVAANFQAKPRHLYFMVMLPAIAPALFSGLRLSVGLGLLGTTAVEFLVSDDGVGHVIWNSWQILSLRQSMAGLVVISLIGYAFYQSVDLLEHWLVPWRRASGHMTQLQSEAVSR